MSRAPGAIIQPMKRLTLALALPLLFAFGCQKDETAPPKEAPPTDVTGQTEPHATDEQKPDEPRKLVGGEMKDGEDVAVMETTAGTIVLRFFPKEAPKTVENFQKLAKKGYYDGTKFHRTIEGFMIQGGDPNTKGGDPSTWGQGGPGYTIKDELNDIQHTPGILSMAKTSAPDTGGSQFFIMVGDAHHLDRVHTAFGEVVKGMDVVHKIEHTQLSGPNGQVDPGAAASIKSLKIEKWPLKE